MWCVAQEIYYIYFHGGLILFLLSINVPLNKLLILICLFVCLAWFCFLVFVIRWEIKAQVKGGGEVEEKRHEDCRGFILGVRKVSCMYLSAEIVNLKWVAG